MISLMAVVMDYHNGKSELYGPNETRSAAAREGHALV